MINDTLPDLVKYQALECPYKVALRHKQLGIWQEKNWSVVLHEVLQLVQFLRENGFSQHDTLYLLSDPRPEALLISLAAQWLGGDAAPLNPHVKDAELFALLKVLQPKFVFAEAQQQVDQVSKLQQLPSIVIYADPRGLAGYSHSNLTQYSGISHGDELDIDNRPNTSSDAVAFTFYRLSIENQLEFQTLTHAEMLSSGRQLVDKEQLTDHEEALVARAFAASGHVRYLLAPWLVTGFRLNFPESMQTRDADRRELGPTIVAGTKQTYQRLELLIQSRLPVKGTLLRKLIDSAFASTSKKSFLFRYIADWLFIAPLIDVIGFRRTRVPLLVGEPLPASSIEFFKSIGMNIRNWSELSTWNKSDRLDYSSSSQLYLLPIAGLNSVLA